MDAKRRAELRKKRRDEDSRLSCELAAMDAEGLLPRFGCEDEGGRYMPSQLEIKAIGARIRTMRQRQMAGVALR